jgi:hypothetical protein
MAVRARRSCDAAVRRHHHRPPAPAAALALPLQLYTPSSTSIHPTRFYTSLLRSFAAPTFKHCYTIRVYDNLFVWPPAAGG